MVNFLGLSQHSGDLNLKMYQSESSREKPDNFLFFENNNAIETNKVDQQDRKWFLTEAIRDLFVTKPAIYISSASNISFICIPCLDGPLKVLDVNEFYDLNQLHKYWFIVHSNLQGAIIDTHWDRYKWATFDKVDKKGLLETIFYFLKIIQFLI